jgi:hypothetical protein
LGGVALLLLVATLLPLRMSATRVEQMDISSGRVETE